MKIAVFDNVPEGGAKRVIAEQCKYLHGRGHTLIHYTSAVSTRFDTATWATIRSHSLFLPHFSGFLRPLTELGYIGLAIQSYSLAHTIDAQKPDVCLVHPCMYTQAPLLLLFLKTPTVYFIEEPPRIVYETKLFPYPSKLLTRFYERLRRYIIRMCDKAAVNAATQLLANSKYISDTVERIYHRDCISAPLGVAPDTFFPAEVVNNRSYFLWVGARDEVHGYPLFNQACAILRQIIPLKSLEFADTQLPYTDAEVRTFYQGAYATLCLSHNEPFGLVALESQACGTPVIAVDEGGYHHTLINGRTGCHIKRDARELAQALQLYLDSRKCQKQSEEAVHYVRTQWSWKKHGEILERILKKTIQVCTKK